VNGNRSLKKYAEGVHYEVDCSAIPSVKHLAGGLQSVLPLVLTTVIEEEGGVYDFQLTQTGHCTLRLAVGPDGTAGAARARTALQRSLSGHAIDSIGIEIEALAPRRSSLSGKLRRVVYAPHERHAMSELAL
jgi:phenylacetate-CoA ligase